jgi:hypothetical protein
MHWSSKAAGVMRRLRVIGDANVFVAMAEAGLSSFARVPAPLRAAAGRRSEGSTWAGRLE